MAMALGSRGSPFSQRLPSLRRGHLVDAASVGPLPLWRPSDSALCVPSRPLICPRPANPRAGERGREVSDLQLWLLWAQRPAKFP